MKEIDQMIQLALQEDMPNGDISTDFLFTDQVSTANFIAKENGIISGMNLVERTFYFVDSEVQFTPLCQNGDEVKKGQIIAMVSGKTASILKGERVGLNFLQRMSGIATLTNQFVKKTANSNTTILDTRKTTPTLRLIEKQAVRDGGGQNHRLNLSDMVMLKDNHIKAAGSITSAVEIVKKHVSKEIKIEVEVETMSQFLEALKTECDIIMLDNMSNDLMAECVKINQHTKKLEASGNMTLDRIEAVCATGVDYISVGALTHSYQSLDISLKF